MPPILSFTGQRILGTAAPMESFPHYIARQGHIGGSAAAWPGPLRLGWGLCGLLLPIGSGAPSLLGTAPGLASREGSEGQSLADFPGGLQKYICLFDLISKPSRESLGYGGGRRKVSSSPFSLSLLMSLLSIFSQRQCFLLCDTYHVFLLLLGCLAVVPYDGWVGVLGLN